MICGVYSCPICGGLIVYDNKDNRGLVIIKTKRRSTVLVHKDCIKQSANKEDNK